MIYMEGEIKRMEKDLKLAVLIDADNISDKYIKIILDETAKNGIATYKRIYGDWTSTRNSSWKSVLLDNSIMPIQQYSYTVGKNATDSAMIIDAMDILYSGTVDGFCIVSSDSDFTRLVARLRESGMMVVGMGESKTPKPFISACNQFKYLDILLTNEQEEEAAPIEETAVVKKAASKKKPVVSTIEPKPQTDLKVIRKAIISIVKENSEDDGWINPSVLKNQLTKRYPDFDVRNFGYSKFTSFINSLTILKSSRSNNLVKYQYIEPNANTKKGHMENK